MMVPICVYVRGFEGRVASWGFWRASLSENSSQNSTMDNVPLLRQEAGGRSLLRAYHFLTENECVREQVSALQKAG